MTARIIWLGGSDPVAMEAHVRRIVPEADFTLETFPVADWNRDLSPWAAPAVFGDEAFSGGGAATLARLEALLGGQPAYLAGYSLAGLFALWAMCECPLIRGVACCSPSLWFPGWEDYAQAHPLPEDRVLYLSLGMKEERTRHPVMRRVGDAVRREHERASHLAARQLTWHPGGHFTDPEGRVAQGIAWVVAMASATDA